MLLMYCQIFPAVCRDIQVLFPCIHDVFSGTTFQDFCNFNYFSKIDTLSSERLSASVRYALWDLSNLECTRHWWYSTWCWKHIMKVTVNLFQCTPWRQRQKKRVIAQIILHHNTRMGQCSQLYILVTLSPGKKPLVPILYDGWVPQPIWTLKGREKPLAPAGHWTTIPWS